MRLAEAIAALAVALAAVGARAGDGSVVLRWKPVDEAVAYELEIGTDSALQRVLVRERVPSPGYRWRELPDERRYWRVRGIDAFGRAGRWSEVKALEAVLRAPEPRRPADGAAVPGGAEVEFACAPSPVVEAYELEIATDPDFAAVVERRDAPDPRFRVALRAGSYHWRARATSVDGRTTRWSPVRRLSVAEVAVAPPALALAAAAELEPAAPPDLAPGSSTPAVADVAISADAVPTAEGAAAPDVAAAGAAASAAGAGEHEGASALAAAEPAAVATDAPVAEAAAPPIAATAEAAADDAGSRRLRVGARLGWHTNFGSSSGLSPGVEAEWNVAPEERLSLSVRVEYHGASATIPPSAGIAAWVETTAHVVPLAAALVWTQPFRSFDVYGGAGLEAQLAYTAVAGEERLDVVPGTLLLAGVARRFGRGDLFVEAGFSSGELEVTSARMRTGGLSVAVGFRGGP